MQELVDTYLSAWNRRDTKGLLELMHEGVSYYDSFWRETCVGRDVAQYLRDIFDEEDYFYEQVGEPITTEDGVIIRYAARERNGSEIGDVRHTGADVLTLRDGKVLTVSDFYCELEADSLREVARLASRRHGETRYANSGLGALKSWLVREQLLELIEANRMYLDPELTLAEVAQHVGCPIDQLQQVILNEFRMDFDGFVQVHRTNYASELLLQASNEPNFISHIATQSGFSSKDAFCEAFAGSFGMSPREYQRLNSIR
jgi:AraC-like DNA-binding protein